MLVECHKRDTVGFMMLAYLLATPYWVGIADSDKTAQR